MHKDTDPRLQALSTAAGPLTSTHVSMCWRNHMSCLVLAAACLLGLQVVDMPMHFGPKTVVSAHQIHQDAAVLKSQFKADKGEVRVVAHGSWHGDAQVSSRK